LGSTEIYPFTNQSEIITDITSTGSTLKANNLKVLKDGIILSSVACLLVSKKSLKNNNKSKIIHKLLNQIKKLWDINPIAPKIIIREKNTLNQNLMSTLKGDFVKFSQGIK